MPIELSCSKAVNLLRKKSQKFNTDIVTYRLSKFLNGCQGYNKLQPRILPRGLSSLIRPKNDDDDCTYYFHNRPQIKQLYRQQESLDESVVTKEHGQVVKTAKNVKRVIICDQERTVEHTREVTTHKFYRATWKIITMRRASSKKKTITEQHPIDATVKSRTTSPPNGVKSILRKQKPVESFIPKVLKDVDNQPTITRGLHKSRSVDVDTEFDESDFNGDGTGIEIVTGKPRPVSPSPIVVLKEDPDTSEPEEKMLQQLFPNMKLTPNSLQNHATNAMRRSSRKRSVTFTDQHSGAAIPSFLLTYQGGLLFTEDEIYAIPSEFTVLSSSDC